MKLKFVVDDDRYGELSFDALIAFQQSERGKQPDLEGMRDAMIVFLQDDNGEWVDEDTARSLVGKIKARELEGAFNELQKAIVGYAVPKANGNNSYQPTTQEEKPLDG